MDTSLKISLFFELLWLDHIPAGTYIPPVLSAASIAALMLHSIFGLAAAPKALVPMLLCIPLALLGIKVESLLRRWNKRSYNMLLSWVRERTPKTNVPSVIMLRSFMAALCAYWAFFFISALVLVPLTDFILSSYGWRLAEIPVTWASLWLAASLGGLLSLRLNRAYVFTGLTAIGIMIFLALPN